MRVALVRSVLTVLIISAGLQASVFAQGASGRIKQVQLGPRPYFLVDDMNDSELKSKLQSCESRAPRSSLASIGHRGAALQFPEHTLESYTAAARQGAGIVECDVVFTKDHALVCRHAQDDLATTTDILVKPDLAAKCTQPFQPATFNPDGSLATPASAQCRTSDLTLAEFKLLKGKMDGFNSRATTPEQFMAGTANFRTDLYSGPTSGTLMTHAESIALFKKLGVGMTPELKAPAETMPFVSESGELTYDELRQKVIDEYKAAKVSPRNVWVQSFEREDIDYWLAREPNFGEQAVYLESAGVPADLPNYTELRQYSRDGINIVGAPLFALMDVNASREIVPSQYALDARAAGLDIIGWTLERSGFLGDGEGGSYYQTVGGPNGALSNEGDVYEALDMMFQKIGIIGMFSDWPATVTYYTTCFNIR